MLVHAASRSLSIEQQAGQFLSLQPPLRRQKQTPAQPEREKPGSRRSTYPHVKTRHGAAQLSYSRRPSR